LKRLSEREPIPSYRKASTAVVLTGIAGYVDVVGYLSLSHILNANMSGNTIGIAYRTVEQHADLALHRGWAVLMFVVGLFVAAFIHEIGNRKKFRPVAAITLGIEAGLLTAYVYFGTPLLEGAEIKPSPPMFYALLAFSTLAMGIQNATLTRVGALSVRTTHVTGTISKFAESGSRYLFWLYDRVRAGRSWIFAVKASPKQRDFIATALTAVSWLAFLAGGFAGAWLKHSIELRSLYIPVVILAVISVSDVFVPLAE
jgi:Predicted membrane protein